MSRKTGLTPYSSNFEVLKDAPLDCRCLVDSYSDLVKSATWANGKDSNYYVYQGMVVTCKDKPGKLYQLTSTDYTNYDNWKTIGDTSELEQKIEKKADKGDSLADYGILDAKIENGVITLGSETITPITEQQSLDNCVLNLTVTGNGNAITSIEKSGSELIAKKETTFLTTHQDITGKVNKSGDTMTGNLTFSSSSSLSLFWDANFTSLDDDTVSYSDTDTVKYDIYTSNRVSLNGELTYLYAPNEWVLLNGKLVTISGGSRPIFIKTDYDSPYLLKDDQLVIIGTNANQSGLVDKVITPTSYIKSITTTTDSSGAYVETITYSSSHNNNLSPIFIYRYSYIKEIYYNSGRDSLKLYFNSPHKNSYIYLHEDHGNSHLMISAYKLWTSRVNATEIVKRDSSDDYFLLGGGGTVKRSNYLTSDVKYLPLTGGTLTGSLTAPSLLTGTSDSAYFLTKKTRGEGDASTYYHAVDWGYSGHNQVDFYEYGGVWNFWSNQSSTAGGTKVGSITTNGWEGSAALTGTPTAPTAAAGTSTTQIATTSFVNTAVNNSLRVYLFTSYDTIFTPTIATNIPATATGIALSNDICFYSKSNVFLVKVTYYYNAQGYIVLFRIKNGYAVGSLGTTVINTKLDDKYVQNSAPDASAIYVCTDNNVIYRGTSSGLTQMYGSLATKNSLSFSDLTNKPTTLSGYGITDALNKTGDTATGRIVLQGGTYVWKAGNTSATTGYLKIADIVISGAYQRTPIELTLAGKGWTMKVIICFLSSSDNDPYLNMFNTYFYNRNLHLIKTDTSKWSLYVYVAAYEEIDVLNYLHPKLVEKTSITWTDVFSTSLPTTYKSLKNSTYVDYVTSTSLSTSLSNYVTSTSLSTSLSNYVKTSDVFKGSSGTTGMFGKIPSIGTDGVMEIGRYIDFHYSNTEEKDYNTRLCTNTPNLSVIIELPTTSGKLALTTDIDYLDFKNNGTIGTGSNAGDININSNCVIDLDGFILTPTLTLGNSSNYSLGELLVYYDGAKYTFDFSKAMSLGLLTNI